jgi:hypothetical protein
MYTHSHTCTHTHTHSHTLTHTHTHSHTLTHTHTHSHTLTHTHSQFVASVTDDCRVVIYHRDMFIIQATYFRKC